MNKSQKIVEFGLASKSCNPWLVWVSGNWAGLGSLRFEGIEKNQVTKPAHSCNGRLNKWLHGVFDKAGVIIGIVLVRRTV